MFSCISLCFLVLILLIIITTFDDNNVVAATPSQPWQFQRQSGTLNNDKIISCSDGCRARTLLHIVLWLVVHQSSSKQSRSCSHCVQPGLHTSRKAKASENKKLDGLSECLRQSKHKTSTNLLILRVGPVISDAFRGTDCLSNSFRAIDTSS